MSNIDNNDKAINHGILGYLSTTKKNDFVLPSFPNEPEAFECRLGRILIGRSTNGHKDRLERLGYTATIENGTTKGKAGVDNVKYLFVDCEGFVDETHINDLPKIAEEHKLIHYRTKIDFGNGEIISGIEAIKKLGPWSCLMAAPLDDLTCDR